MATQAVTIDPQTGERVQGGSPANGAPQIDPTTGERISAPDDRNEFQKGVDNLTRYVGHPEDRGEGKPNAANRFGEGVLGSTLGAIAHPVESAKGIVKSILPDKGAAGIGEMALGPVGPTAVHTVQNLIHDPARTVGGIVGGTALGEGGGMLMRGAGGALRSGAASLDNAAIGSTADAFEHGANPGQALSTNRVVGTNAATLSPKVKALIPDAVAEHRGIVSGNQGGQTINAGPIVSNPFTEKMAAATDPVTGAATPAQVAKAGNTQRILTHAPDEQTGRVTPMMRNPTLTPLQATELKSNIYGMTDYDNPSRAAISNSGLKGAAHGLKTAVEQAVPESVESGQRLHNLMSAKDILEPQARGVRIPTSKSGLMDRAATGAATTGAAGMDIAGEAAQHLSRFLHPGPIYAAPAIGRRPEDQQ